MKSITTRIVIFLSTVLLLAYCNNSTKTAKQINTAQVASSDSSLVAKGTDSITEHNTIPDFNTATNNADTSATAQRNNNGDSMLSQMINLTSTFGKIDSGILKNLRGSGNMDSMMKKMQSIMDDKNETQLMLFPAQS